MTVVPSASATAVRAASAQAHANIALIKYWGKRDKALNLPAVPSLSVTVAGLSSRTRIRFDPALAGDSLYFGGRPAAGGELDRVHAILDTMRALAGAEDLPARVDTDNDFPTAAGLASSASGFAALVVAADAALGLDLPAARLSALARAASGSAARSLFGGVVEMAAGTAADGSDATARPLLAAASWPLEIVIAITDSGPKAVGSTDGMDHTAATSPYYTAWLASAPADLERARDAVQTRDFDALARVSEASCLRMHASALAAEPGLIYWRPATLAAIECVRGLQAGGVPVFFTIDAGPQLKAICAPGHGDAVAAALADVPGVERTLVSGLGDGARVITEEDDA